MEDKAKSPLVSIIIPTYNRNAMLKRAIQSIINQTYRNIELLVVDDGKNESTKCVVNSFNDKRTKYFGNSKKGANAARNLGVQQAKGEYITFLDDDDEYYPRKIESQLHEAFYNNADMVFCLLDFMYPSNKTERFRPPITGGILFKKLLLVYNFISLPAIFCKKKVLCEVGMFDETLKSYHDWDLSIRIIFGGYKVTCVHQHLIKVYKHNEGRIGDNDESVGVIFKKYINLEKNVLVCFLHLLYSIKNRMMSRFFIYMKTVW